MNIRGIEFGMTMLKLAVAITPDLEKVVSEIEDAGSGEKPTLAEVWPQVQDAMNTAITTTPIGKIKV